MTSALDELLEAPPENPLWPSALPALLSPTQITTFLACPEQYRRRYLLRERVRPSVALIIGRADSKAREADLGHKIVTGLNLSDSDVKVAAAESFDQAVEADGGVGEVDWEASKPGTAKDLSVLLASAYHTQISLALLPIAVEERLELTIPGVVPLIHGFLDVRLERRVKEVKTSAKRRLKPLPDWLIQSELYSAATGLPVEFDVSVKSARPEVLTAARDPGLQGHADGLALARLERRVQSVAGGILALYRQFGADEAWPATGAGGLLPHCGICDWRPDCPFAVV
jgi:hypothetical protein